MKRMEERQAEMMAKRKLRYEELRKRAEAAGLSLPETPPWEEAGMTPPEMPPMPEMPSMPEMPAMPSWPGQTGMTGMEGMGPAQTGPSQYGDWQALREQAWQARRDRAAQRGVDMPDKGPWNLLSPEERQAHREEMRNAATPEERAALRDKHWTQLRERATAQGMTLPETPPWKEAEQRREAMKARWESYRQIIDQMSAEEREAAEAIFGQMPQPPEMPAMPEMGRDMMPPMPYGRDFGTPAPRAYPPMTPGYGGPGYGEPAYARPGAGGPGYGGPGLGGPGFGGPGYGIPGAGGYDQPRPWPNAMPGQMSAPMMMPNSGYNRW
jgi:hypothetical protein